MRTASALGALATVLAVLAGCSGGAGGEAAEREAPPEAKLTASVTKNAKDVPVTEPITLKAAKGKLTDAKLTNEEGKPVDGEFSKDKKTWTSSEPLGYGKTYNYTATAAGSDRKSVPMRGSFSTVAPSSVVRATLNPTDHQTVGVAMPISVKFEAPVQDKAAAERALKVETSVPVEGSWAWLNDQQVDWRPKEYWPAHTKVNVSANLYGVHYGGGAYGKTDVTTEFEIGREQIVKIHTPDHRMNVYRDGQQVASYPASNGKDADPNLNTPNGTFIVMSKEEVGNFSNPQYGYTDVMKKWAVRFSNHGEFIHENEENAANIGVANTSHGCVNLRESDANEYFQGALIGDPVEVTGSQATMEAKYDVYDWLIPWSQWQSMSELG
ncbi:MAG: L,D-transpeptidase family protein [Pseudonocardiaceae bacterium]|nr:L,D-transpeptidase family protein [Pseudonocardiaceae bacterium]